MTTHLFYDTYQPRCSGVGFTIIHHIISRSRGAQKSCKICALGGVLFARAGRYSVLQYQHISVYFYMRKIFFKYFKFLIGLRNTLKALTLRGRRHCLLSICALPQNQQYPDQSPSNYCNGLFGLKSQHRVHQRSCLSGRSLRRWACVPNLNQRGDLARDSWPNAQGLYHTRCKNRDRGPISCRCVSLA